VRRLGALAAASDGGAIATGRDLAIIVEANVPEKTMKIAGQEGGWDNSGHAHFHPQRNYTAL
jgi:hypothetical protein